MRKAFFVVLAAAMAVTVVPAEGQRMQGCDYGQFGYLLEYGYVSVSLDDTGAVRQVERGGLSDESKGPGSYPWLSCAAFDAPDPLHEVVSALDWFDGVTPDAAAAESYDVILSLTGEPRTSLMPVTLRIRRLGAWTRSERTTLNGDMIDQIAVNDLSISSRTNPDGERHLLGLRRFMPVTYEGRAAGDLEPVDAPGLMEGMTNAPVLSEHCVWWDVGSVASGYDRYDCLTDDGIPLVMRLESRFGEVTEIRAISLLRGRVSPQDVAIPPKWLDPETWDLTE